MCSECFDYLDQVEEIEPLDISLKCVDNDTYWPLTKGKSYKILKLDISKDDSSYLVECDNGSEHWIDANCFERAEYVP